MDIIIMDMGTIIINHHKVTTQTCHRNPLSGHEKAMLLHNVQHGFFISVSGGIFFSLLFFNRSFPLTRMLRIVNIFQVIPLAIEAEDIRWT